MIALSVSLVNKSSIIIIIIIIIVSILLPWITFPQLFCVHIR